MEFKKCEHCGEKIHIRSKKCPFCNEVVEENPAPEEIIREDAPEINDVAEENKEDEFKENEFKENDMQDAINQFKKGDNEVKENINFVVGNGEPKDYVYKAEVRHSIEYVEPMSNWFKVFISALCTFPLIGQLLGSFLGVYFVTYEDTDRRGFGKALITLSIVMFFIYCAYLAQMMTLMQNLDLEALYNSLGK